MIRELGFEVMVAVQSSVATELWCVVGRLQPSQVTGDGGVVTAWREAGGWVVVSMIWRLSASSDPLDTLEGDSSG